MINNNNGHKIKKYPRRKSHEEEVLEKVTVHKGHHVHNIIRISQEEINRFEAALAVERAHTKMNVSPLSDQVIINLY